MQTVTLVLTEQQAYHINALARSALYGDVKVSDTSRQDVRAALAGVVFVTDEATNRYAQEVAR